MSSFRSAACWHIRNSLIFGQVYLTTWLANRLGSTDMTQLVFLMSGVSACCQEEP